MHLDSSVELNWAGLDSELDSIGKAINLAFFNLLDSLAVVLATAFEARAGNWLWANLFLWLSSLLSLASLALFLSLDFLYVLLRFLTSFCEFFVFCWGFSFDWSFFDYRGLDLWSLKFFGIFLSCHEIPFAVQTAHRLPTLNFNLF